MWNPVDYIRNRSKFAGDAVWVTFANFGQRGFGLLQTIGMVTLLSVGKYALFGLATAAISLVYSFVDVRVDEALIKLFAEYRTKGDHGRAKRMVQVAFVVNAIIACIVFVISFFVIPPIARWWFKDVTAADRPLLVDLIRIFAFVPLAGFAQGTCLGIMQALKEFRRYSALMWLSAFLRFAVPVGLAYWGVRAAMIGFVGVTLACSCVMLPFALAMLARYLDPTPAVPLGEDRKRVIHFNIQTMLSVTVKGLTQSAPLLILGHFSQPGVTYFKLASAVVSLMQSATQALGQVSFPNLSEHWARDHFGKFKRLIGKVTLAAAAVAVPTAIVLALVTPLGLDAINYLKAVIKGPSVGKVAIHDLVPLVYVMLPGSLVICLTLWLRPASLAMGRPVLSTIFNTLIGAIAVVGTWLLAKRYGAAGAAWTYTIMWSVGLGLYALTVLRCIPKATGLDQEE